MDDDTLIRIMWPNAPMMDDDSFKLPMRFALSLSSIGLCINNFAKSLTSKIAKKHAKYTLGLLRKDTTFPARFYLECLDEYGAESTFCKGDKERWLERKAVQNGNEIVWNAENEEEIYKMLKKDAIKAGYKKGYCIMKDPDFLKRCARDYEKCIAKYGVGAEDTLCSVDKRVWLEVKAFQNGI